MIGAPERRPFDLCFRLKAVEPWSCFDVGEVDILPGMDIYQQATDFLSEVCWQEEGSICSSGTAAILYAPVLFEVSGGFPDSVLQLLSKATEVAGKNKVKPAAADWSWSAMDWSPFHLRC